jgi:hypothetical protein
MSQPIDRRSFNVAWAYALLGGATITLTGCGGGSNVTGTGNPTPTPSPTASGDKAGNINANHGHAVVITAAQLQAGGELTLDIKADAPHSHTVSLTAAEVTNVAAGQTVTKETTSSDGGASYGGSHSHSVTFN